MRQVEAEGKTREEAVEKALRELGVEMYEVDRIEVLDSGSRGIFGWGARPVRVRLTIERLEEKSASRSGASARRDVPQQKNAPVKPKSAQSVPNPPQQQPRQGAESGRRPGGQPARQNNRKPQQRPQQGKNRNDPPGFLKQAEIRKQKAAASAPAAQKPQSAEPQSPREAPASAADAGSAVVAGMATPPTSVHHEALEALRRAEQFEQFEKGLIPEVPEAAAGTEETEPAEPPMSEDELGRAETVLSELLAKMGVQARITRGTCEDGAPRLIIDSPHSGQIIGKNGRTLESLQYLLNRLITPDAALDCRDRIAVDCQGYLERKWRALREMAREFARRAVKTGKPQRMRPMPPQERRVIHIALKEHPDVTTVSEGSGYMRSVRVTPLRPGPAENPESVKSKARTGRHRPRRRRPGSRDKADSGQDAS